MIALLIICLTVFDFMDLLFGIGLIVFLWATIKILLYVWFNVINSKPFEWATNNGQYWAVITGSTDGIGYEYAKQLGQKGYNLMLISRSQEKLDRTRQIFLKEMPTIKIETLAVDFGHTDIYDRIKQFVEPKLEDIFILVNNVGIYTEIPVSFIEQDEDFYCKMINVNLVTATRMTRMILPSMFKHQRGLVVFVSSLICSTPFPLLHIYGATKSYITYLARSLMQECLPNNVLVYLLSPAFISTKFIHSVRRIMMRVPTAEEYVQSSLKQIHWSTSMESTGHWKHTLWELIISVSVWITSPQTFASLTLTLIGLWTKTFDKVKSSDEKREALELPLTKTFSYLYQTIKAKLFNSMKQSKHIEKVQ